MLIDSHAHLSFKDYSPEELEALIARSQEAGVDSIINIGAGEGFEGNLKAVEVASQFPNIYATVGIHPHDAQILTPAMIDDLRNLAQNSKVVAIGEIGLDFYYSHSEHSTQEKVFRQMIHLAKELRLPISIHVRDAYERLYEIMKEEKAFECGGVIHCFSGDWNFAKKMIDEKFYLSFSGIITFKKSHELREVVEKTPTEYILIETDSPYLTPEPFRGKRNEPAHVQWVAKKIAEIKKLSFEDVARVTSLNTRRLFRLGEIHQEVKIAYRIRNSLYLNITNVCTLACSFCPKFTTFEVKGYYLRLPKAPSFEEVVAAMGDFSDVEEVVFCGFVESTQLLDFMKQLAEFAHQHDKRVRLDTDGLGNLLHQRNIAPELEGIIDAISVSLNAPDAETYAKICPSRHQEKAYPFVKEFIREIKKFVPDVTASVVGVPGLDIEKCRQVAEEELQVKFRLREYNHVG
ncbi:MAG: YchF/TatD family DNA exonuclease [Deltaproteobacteria bacterium]|nr:YchF/TatD family DNA exonuclease [Deltaproteobacteria bacterium]